MERDVIFMKKTILVTGGAGFLGSHLCRKLCAEGSNVICFDNLSTGAYENIRALERDPQFRFVEGDVERMPEIKADEIYNLACPASPCHYQLDPVKTIRTNALGVMNILELARNNTAKVVQASTSEVYGNPSVHPQVESYTGNVNPVGVRACYDEGKRIGETLCYAYRKMYRIRVGIVRIFNTYGPRMRNDDGRVISNFICQALGGENITVYGDGTQTRSFCYVDDLIEGLSKMMQTAEAFGPINLGNPVEITVSELAEKVLEMTGGNSEICYTNLPEDDPVRRKPDIALAEKMLGWRPRIQLEEGLDKTIRYFKSIMSV